MPLLPGYSILAACVLRWNKTISHSSSHLWITGESPHHIPLRDYSSTHFRKWYHARVVRFFFLLLNRSCLFRVFTHSFRVAKIRALVYFYSCYCNLLESSGFSETRIALFFLILSVVRDGREETAVSALVPLSGLVILHFGAFVK